MIFSSPTKTRKIMTIRAFEFTRTWNEIPVTIFAHDLDDAEQIYRDWVRSHHPDQSGLPLMIFPYGEDRLEARHLLFEAATRGETGVGYWHPSKRAWAVGQQQVEQLGELAPPAGNVGYYQVTAEPGDDAKVFATSFDEATTLYCAWHIDAYGSLPERFFVDRRSRWGLTGELATLRDDLEAEITGVARKDNEGMWRVLPPDWEPIIMKR
jgi:hypothetical protein